MRIICRAARILSRHIPLCCREDIRALARPEQPPALMHQVLSEPDLVVTVDSS